MNTKFFIGGRWYKTPCKTVLNADTFRVKFFTGVHIITAFVADKCYFETIDNIVLSDIKCDFYFGRNYSKPKEFLSNLYETLANFLNTSFPFTERHFPHSTDDVIRGILENFQMKDDSSEITDPEVGEFVYDVVIHNFYGCDTYTVRADGLESAKDKALKIMKDESLDDDYYSIDSIRIYEENSDELLKEIIFEPSEAEDATEKELEKLEKELIEPVDTHIYDIQKFKEKTRINSLYGISSAPEPKELLSTEQFERLTRTLYKSLFKAIGLQDTRKIHFTISNGLVFFNYKGSQYKYYPSQCKIFKKQGRKYQRINWKDFAEENNSDGQKQNRGRSPPFLLLI